ncbi:MAG TPA: hypothetical protein VGN72_24040 [Tepidisphaeraceae bacterium]|jgi:hypothetical protein|nr:hypothetical protein [Tepidisphaeraceae bacterium]
MIMPPPDYDPADPSSLQRLPVPDDEPAVVAPLPIEFDFTGSATSPTVRSIEHSLRRHRLLFLWQASPSHIHVPLEMTPDKGRLYDILGLDLHAPATTRPADAILQHDAGINQWLAEQQRALGTGSMGRPLRSLTGQFPVPAYALWRFEGSRHRLMIDSHQAVARSVGASLSASRPAWMVDADIETIRAACERSPRPQVVSDWGDLWDDRPEVRWDYPDLLWDAIGKLAPLVAIEAGASGRETPALRYGDHAKCRAQWARC